MSRPFDFTRAVQRQARMRQFGRCAVCGERLDYLEEHAHHVVPNQAGNPRDPAHAWLRSADNCVVLCHLCHERVHQDGRYRNGAVAPPVYYKFSHGPNAAAHQAWVQQALSRTGFVWR